MNQHQVTCGRPPVDGLWVQGWQAGDPITADVVYRATPAVIGRFNRMAPQSREVLASLVAESAKAEGAAVSTADLAEACRLHPSQASAVLRRLEEDGWIVRSGPARRLSWEIADPLVMAVCRMRFLPAPGALAETGSKPVP